MKFLGKKLVVLMAVVLAITSLGGCAGLKNTDVAATVGKVDIPAGVANFYARLQEAQYETYYASFMGDDMWSTEAEEGKTYEESVKESLLTLLEDMYLLEQHAEEYDVTISDEEKAKIDKAAEEFVNANTLEDKEIVSGDKEYVQKVLELLTIQSKMDEPMKAGVDEEVSDDEAAQKSMTYLQFTYTMTDADGQTQQMTDEEKTAQQETAKTFAKKLKESGSTDLEAAAKEAGLEANLSTVTFDSTSTNPEADVIKAADAVEKEGNLTDLITTDYGLYICKVTSFLDREATDAKKTDIVTERKQKQYDDTLAKWREETEIKEHKKVWDKISFVNQGVTMKQETEEPYAVGSDSTTSADYEASTDTTK